MGSEPAVILAGPLPLDRPLDTAGALVVIVQDIVVKAWTLAGRPAMFALTWDGFHPAIERAANEAAGGDLIARCEALVSERVDSVRAGLASMGVVPGAERPVSSEKASAALAALAARGRLARDAVREWWCTAHHAVVGPRDVELGEAAAGMALLGLPTEDLRGVFSADGGRPVLLAAWVPSGGRPAAVAVHPDAEYLAYALEQHTVVVAKDRLVELLGAVAPGQLTATRVRLGPGQLEATALADVTRVRGYASGDDLAGMRCRTGPGQSCPVVVDPEVDVAVGTGLELQMDAAPTSSSSDGPADGRLDLQADVRRSSLSEDGHGDGGLVRLGAAGRLAAPGCRQCGGAVVTRRSERWVLRGQAGPRPISRRGQWGLPVPLACCERCGVAVMATAAGRRCPSCGGPARTAEDEVLEPWFTAACESWGVTADVALDGPARRWLEDVERIHQGSGSSPPFRAALTHGHAAGSITPEDIVHRHGPDVLRLWAATLGSGDPLSWDSLQSLADRVKEIRTALDRLVDRLHQLAPGPAPFASGPAAARPDAASSAPLVRDVALAYRTLRPDLVAPRVLGFLRAELDPFLARTAEVLHRPLEDPERRAAAASTRQLVRELCILLAPVLSFTAEATWSHLPDPGPASVFLAAFPRVSGSGDDGPGDEA